jgi:hypothetical protein
MILATAFGFFANSVLSLSLRANEENGLPPVFGYLVRDKPERVAKHTLSFLKINNVNAVALAEDVFLHLGIPAPNLVAEVYASLQEFFHRNLNQTKSPFQ